jgi:hypothetical protein
MTSPLALLIGTAAPFAQFESGKDGKLGVLRLTFAADGQAYEFSRD